MVLKVFNCLYVENLLRYYSTEKSNIDEYRKRRRKVRRREGKWGAERAEEAEWAAGEAEEEEGEAGQGRGGGGKRKGKEEQERAGDGGGAG